MDLVDFVNERCSSDSGEEISRSEAFPDVAEELGSAAASALIASVFWQIFQRSDTYLDVLNRAGASPIAGTSAEAYVVARQRERFDLVVLDPGLVQSEARATRIELGRNDDRVIADAQRRWREEVFGDRWGGAQFSPRRLGQSFNRRILRALIGLPPYFVQELMSRVPFELLLAPAPPTYRTGIPNPALPMSVGGAGPDGTVGIFALNSEGVPGLTVSRHPFVSAGIDPRMGVPVVVNGHSYGRIRTSDATSDSCFVEWIEPGFGSSQNTTGPLRGASPRSAQRATFRRFDNTEVETVITGWCPDIPFTQPWVQLRVLTKACTKRGDSGAALVDDDGHIVGFAMYRTGVDAPIEYSAWVWADSVYLAHQLIAEGD